MRAPEELELLSRNGARYLRSFVMRIKLCRKEAEESRYWLKLRDTQDDPQLENERKDLEQEATELTSIFGSILRKSESRFEHLIFEF